MDYTELKKLLQDNLTVSQETLKIVKQLNRARLWGRFFFFLKWGIILALLIVGFITIQPYLELFTNNIEQLSDTLSQLKNLSPGQ
ncbi:MAG: hypothetical protein Q8O83_02090 [bacterium]|nr:hypothetical protein [bacterium]